MRDVAVQRQQLAAMVEASAAADRDQGAAMQQLRAQLDAAKEGAERQARDAAVRAERLAVERDEALAETAHWKEVAARASAESSVAQVHPHAEDALQPSTWYPSIRMFGQCAHFRSMCTHHSQPPPCNKLMKGCPHYVVGGNGYCTLPGTDIAAGAAGPRTTATSREGR